MSSQTDTVRTHCILGTCYPVDDRIANILPPHTNPTGMYHRASIKHKTFHSSRYAKKGKRTSSHVCKTKSGSHVLLDCFVKCQNGAVLAVGVPLSYTYATSSFNNVEVPSDVSVSSSKLLSHFHQVVPPRNVSCVTFEASQLLCRCCVHEVSDTHWVLCDFIEDYEHD